MEPTPELIDEMYRERVRAARAMSGEEKVLLGLQLFDCACRIMADGIRDEFPDADEDRVQAILRERLAIARRLEDTIITKLRWSRQGRRPKDVEDVRNVIAVQGQRIDWAYVAAWCRKHGTAELLDTVRRQAVE